VINSIDEIDLKGQYFSLIDIQDNLKEKLIHEHILFNEKDQILESAQGLLYWPHGRGIYVNDKKTLIIWVNEEDHLRIISMQKNNNIKDVYLQLVKCINIINKNIEFNYDDMLGYLTMCPTNIGTTLRISVHIKLVHLSKNMQLFNNICENNNLQIRGYYGEHSKSFNNIYDISNVHYLPYSNRSPIDTLYFFNSHAKVDCVTIMCPWQLYIIQKCTGHNISVITILPYCMHHYCSIKVYQTIVCWPHNCVEIIFSGIYENLDAVV